MKNNFWKERLRDVSRGVDPKKRGGLRKIKSAEEPCRHPEHNPPMHIHLEPGVYEYVCPACGRTVIFSVPPVTF